MAIDMPDEAIDGHLDALFGANSSQPARVVTWLEGFPEPEVARMAEYVFGRLLDDASQPKHASKHACLGLCGFVEQCKKAKLPILRNWAFSETVSLELFNFYIEWNEQDQHRSMRLVLDLLTLLILQNPSQERAARIKKPLIDTLVAIIARRSTRPLVKSAINTLNHLLTKAVVCLEEIAAAYRTPAQSGLSDLQVWRQFVNDVFSWMSLHYVCPVAGKLVVSIFKGLRQVAAAQGKLNAIGTFTVETLRDWLQDNVSASPDMLDNVKTYILTPLFKTDRHTSLDLLELLNDSSPGSHGNMEMLNLGGMLQLAGLEVGKRTGLVKDPGQTFGRSKASKVISLKEDILESVLGHPAPAVRSLAFSLLISSPSTTSPFTPIGIQLIQRYLPAYHADSDAKFRYELLGYCKDMVQRVNGAAITLERSIGRVSKKNFQVSKAAAAADTPSVDATTTKQKYTTNEFTGVGEEQLRKTLALHHDFCSWYLRFLKNELTPTASYQRHITALKVVENMIKLEKDVPQAKRQDTPRLDATTFFDHTGLRATLDLILNPFDDVREGAAVLVMSRIQNHSDQRESGGESADMQIPLAETLQQFCSRADQLARRTARADHADGAARAHRLVYSVLPTQSLRFSLLSNVLDGLEKRLSKAESDLGRASLEDPVHGDFASLKYIWYGLVRGRFSSDEMQVFAQIQVRIADDCRRIWYVVKDVLCDDSPEGHLPQELEETEGLDTKDLLSYSFRAILESSSLMRSIVSFLRYDFHPGALSPPNEVFENIGALSFEQLSNLRHRGAFTAVSQTFTACCQLVKYLPRSGGDTTASPQTPLDAWYDGTLSCIFAQSSTTRRSAGIPALMVGILSANADRPSFEEVVRKLVTIAQTPASVLETDGSNLPQVHALNCLKDVFKTSFLSKRAEKYLPECLQLAAASLKSELWAIRNCGLILLRSLIDCLFGTSDSKSTMETGWDGKTTRISYHKYPTLPGILLSLLQSGHKAMAPSASGQGAESVFPALDIIRRAGPPDESRDELFDHISKYLGSHIWHVREIAARTLCSFLLQSNWIESVRLLLGSANVSVNRCHGVLLTVRFVIERQSDALGHGIYGDLLLLKAILRDTMETNACLTACAEVQAAWLEVANLITKIEFSKESRNCPSMLTNNHHAKQNIPGHNDVEQESMTVAEHNQMARRAALSALLRGQESIYTVQSSAYHNDIGPLKDATLTAVLDDVDTACIMLQALPGIWTKPVAETGRKLCSLYIDICLHTTAPEPRSIALQNLAGVLESSLGSGDIKNLPTNRELQQLWCNLGSNSINPTLSNAIIKVSGLLTAALRLRPGDAPGSRWSLRSWGAMMVGAGRADQGFDTRLAAVGSLKAYATASAPRTACIDPEDLTWLLALYDALNDDDDEIRTVAAEATASLLRRSLMAAEATGAFLAWLGHHFGHLDAFRTHVTCRMVGHAAVMVEADAANWVPAATQLQQAREVDDSLFAVEEQNLFVDEVVETERWARVFRQLRDDNKNNGGGGGAQATAEVETDSGVEGGTTRLVGWVADGLEALLGLAREEEDGPLGWGSQPQMFAICSRILLCARALVEGGRNAPLRDALRRARLAGKQARVHGLLLDMAVVE